MRKPLDLHRLPKKIRDRLLAVGVVKPKYNIADLSKRVLSRLPISAKGRVQK